MAFCVPDLDFNFIILLYGAIPASEKWYTNKQQRLQEQNGNNLEGHPQEPAGPQSRHAEDIVQCSHQAAL